MKDIVKDLFSPKNKDLIKKINPVYAPVGNFGIYTYDDRVIKFTNSLNDFRVSLLLVGKNFKNVVKIYSVHKIKLVDNQKSKRTIYAIEMERLNRTKFLFDEFEIENIISIFKSKKLEITEACSFISSVLNAYLELNSIGVLYFDTHSDNIMIDHKNEYKLIDFGCCTVQRKKS